MSGRGAPSLPRTRVALVACPGYEPERVLGAVRRGIQWAETGPMLETNTQILAQWESIETRQHRRRRCYVKAL